MSVCGTRATAAACRLPECDATALKGRWRREAAAALNISYIVRSLRFPKLDLPASCERPNEPTAARESKMAVLLPKRRCRITELISGRSLELADGDKACFVGPLQNCRRHMGSG